MAGKANPCGKTWADCEKAAINALVQTPKDITMNTVKHAQFTSGPWSINTVCNKAEKLLIVDADMCFVADIWQTYVNGKSRQQDNAHLIAAAPVMYADLRIIRDYLYKLYDDGNMQAGEYAASLDTTLAQAEGRTL